MDIRLFVDNVVSSFLFFHPSVMQTMSSRYPERNRAAPHRYEDEQWTYHILAAMRHEERHYRESLLEDESDDENDYHDAAMSNMVIDDDEKEIEDVLDEEGEMKEEQWTSELSPINIHQFTPPIGHPARIPRSTQSIRDFFHLIIPMSFIQHIVSQTNNHAVEENEELATAQKENRSMNTSGRWKDQENKEEKWENTNDDEISAFIGVMIMMGIVNLTRLTDYWDKIINHPKQPNMRAVDIFSQLQSYAGIGRKQFRWWPKLAWFLIDIAIMNAYVLYTQHHPHKNISKHRFRIQLAQELVSTWTSRKRKGRSVAETHIRNTDEMHTSLLSSTGAHTCSYCSGRRARKKTGYMCEQCNVYAHLGTCMKAHIAEQGQRDG